MLMKDQSRAHLKVLVVDDYLLTREMVVAILKQVGFSNIATAEDGRQALMMLRETNFSLVICDWNMPRMTGIELLREVRQERNYTKVPFLLLTAEAYKENVMEALDAGVTDYITKPFTTQTLLAKLETAMARAYSK